MCELNEQALTARFLEGLSGEIKEEILSRDLPTCLDQLVELAIRLDKRFELRRRARPPCPSYGRSHPLPLLPRWPHQIPNPSAGGLRISAAVRQRHCGGTLHVLWCAGAFPGITSEHDYLFPSQPRLGPPSLPSCAVVAPPFPARLWLTRVPRGILWIRTGYSITAFLFRS